MNTEAEKLLQQILTHIRVITKLNEAGKLNNEAMAIDELMEIADSLDDIIFHTES